MKRTMLIALAFVVCGVFPGQAAFAKYVSGKAPGKETETRTVGKFTGISVDTGISVELCRGEEHEVIVSVNRNGLTEKIETYVKGGILHIGLARGTSLRGRNIEISVKVTAPEINCIEAETGVAIRCRDTFEGEALHIEVDSGSVISGDFDYGRITVEMDSGSSVRGNFVCRDIRIDADSGCHVELTGNADNCMLSLDSGSTAKLRRFRCVNVKAVIDSASTAEVYASGSLRASLDSVSTLRYAGDPGNVDIAAEEFCSVRKID